MREQFVGVLKAVPIKHVKDPMNEAEVRLY